MSVDTQRRRRCNLTRCRLRRCRLMISAFWFRSFARIGRRPHWPALVPDPFPLGQVTSWYMTRWYPEMIDDEPSRSEITDALDTVERLIAAVVLCAPFELRPDG